ncbi:MAG: hypothetical protein LDL41_26595 [Coleofasciculus sp. S288]|nr:hypothetical protein [Coleofasciculus sp. S288]
MPRASVRWIVGVWWTVATVVSLTAAMAVNPVWGQVVGPATLGITQWLVLRQHIPKAGWWILATTLGGVVALYLGSAVSFFTTSILWIGSGVVGGAVGGAILGLAQWLVLRRHVSQAGWWIAASAVALAVGAGWLVYLGIESAFTFDASMDLIQIIRWSGMGALSGAIGGAIKGGALVWLLRQPKQRDL